jgi:hypothetical protein
MDTHSSDKRHSHYRSYYNDEKYRKGAIMMERYITKGIASNLPETLQQQLWKLVAQRENEQFKELEEIDYFHIFQFNMHNSQLYIKHKQERPEYVKIHKANYSKAININKVYIIREDDVDLSYYVMLLPEEY